MIHPHYKQSDTRTSMTSYRLLAIPLFLLRSLNITFCRKSWIKLNIFFIRQPMVGLTPTSSYSMTKSSIFFPSILWYMASILILLKLLIRCITNSYLTSLNIAMGSLMMTLPSSPATSIILNVFNMLMQLAPPLPTLAGFPQGSVLDPLQFTMISSGYSSPLFLMYWFRMRMTKTLSLVIGNGT